MSAATLPVQKAWIGWTAIFSVSLIGAGNFVVSGYAIKASINANDMTALRFGLAGLILLPMLIRYGFASLAGIGWPRGILLTVIAGAPATLLMLWGLHYAPVAHGAVLIPGSMPIFTAIGMWFSAGIRVSKPKLMTFAVIIIGLSLVSGFSIGNKPGILFGDLLFLLAGSCFGTFMVLLRRWQLDGMRVTSVVSVLSLALLPFYYMLISPDLDGASYEIIAFVAIYQGLLNSIAGMLLMSLSVRHIGPQRTALGNATVPVLATLMAVPILSELPTLVQCFGIALVVGGVIISTRVQDVIPTEKNLG